MQSLKKIHAWAQMKVPLCFSYVFYKRKACVYCVVRALFSCICLVRLILKNCSENKYFS